MAQLQYHIMALFDCSSNNNGAGRVLRLLVLVQHGYAQKRTKPVRASARLATRETRGCVNIDEIRGCEYLHHFVQLALYWCSMYLLVPSYSRILWMPCTRTSAPPPASAQHQQPPLWATSQHIQLMPVHPGIYAPEATANPLWPTGGVAKWSRLFRPFIFIFHVAFYLLANLVTYSVQTSPSDITFSTILRSSAARASTRDHSISISLPRQSVPIAHHAPAIHADQQPAGDGHCMSLSP